MASASSTAQVVAAARHRRVHAGAAHLLEGHLLADDLLGHPRRAQVHRRVALDHDHDVAEGRDVGAAGSRRAEQAADLRHPAGELHLVVEDPARAPAAREELHLVGDAGAGGVDQVDDGQIVPASASSVSRTIFSTVRAPHEPAFTVGSLAMTQTGRPSTRPRPGDHAVGRQVGGQGVGEQAVLHERRRRRRAASMRSRTNSLPCRASFVGLGVQVAVEGTRTGRNAAPAMSSVRRTRPLPASDREPEPCARP